MCIHIHVYTKSVSLVILIIIFSIEKKLKAEKHILHLALNQYDYLKKSFLFSKTRSVTILNVLVFLLLLRPPPFFFYQLPMKRTVFPQLLYSYFRNHTRERKLFYKGA